MTLRKYRPDDAEARGWVEDVARVLDRETIRFTYLAADAPYTLRVASTARPVEVRCLSALRDGSTQIENPRVTWEWLGSSLRVHSLDVSTPASEYAVTLELRR